MSRNKNLLTTVFLACGLYVPAQILPYKNPQLLWTVRAKDLVSRLTLKEKITLMKELSDAIYELLYGESSANKDLKTIKIKII